MPWRVKLCRGAKEGLCSFTVLMVWGKNILRCLLNLSGFYLLNYYLQLSPEHPPQPFYLRAIFELTVCLLPWLNHTNSQLITHGHSNLLCLPQKTHACAGMHVSVLLLVPWCCTSWTRVKFVSFVFCPLWCFPPTRPPPTLVIPDLQHHLLLQHQAPVEQKLEQRREIRVCHWTELRRRKRRMIRS